MNLAAALCLALVASAPSGLDKRRAAPMMPALSGPNAGAPLTFARENLFISVHAPVTGADETPSSEDRRYYFDTDIRPEESLQNDWFYSLQNIREGRATMIVLKEAAPIALPEAKLFKPVDILVVGDDGAILAILPDLVPATLEKQLKLDFPVRALIYLGGGSAKRLNIVPKDRVVYRLFKADPTVIQ